LSWIDEKARTDETLARIRVGKEMQIYPYFRKFEKGGLHTQIDGKPVVNWSSNDYLGLTNHPKVKEAAHKALDKYGCGLSSSRVQATTTEHVELEERLAKFFGYEACLVFTTGYQAMLGRRTRTRRSSSTASATPASSTVASSRPGCRARRRRFASSITTRRRASSAS
jgi:7-keto-8-aminopelargonate synthetase-like enzyme